MGVSFNLNDEGITFWQDGIILFDCPIERIQSEPKSALIAMKLIMDILQKEEDECCLNCGVQVTRDDSFCSDICKRSYKG